MLGLIVGFVMLSQVASESLRLSHTMSMCSLVDFAWLCFGICYMCAYICASGALNARQKMAGFEFVFTSQRR